MKIQVVKRFTAENDRIKLLVLLCGEEDDLLIKAALGTLAVLSSLQINLEEFKDVDLDEDDKKKLNDYIEENRIICEKLVNVRFGFFCVCMCEREVQF